MDGFVSCHGKFSLMAIFCLLFLHYEPSEGFPTPPLPLTDPNVRVTSCDNQGIVVNIDGVDTSYYQGYAYAQHSGGSVMEDICGSGRQLGTAWTHAQLRGNWTFRLTLEQMRMNTCGEYITEEQGPGYTSVIVVPRRNDGMELISDYAAIVKCDWLLTTEMNHLTQNMNGIQPIEGTGVFRDTATLPSPNISSSLTQMNGSYFMGAIVLGTNTKLVVYYEDDREGLWAALEIRSLVSVSTAGEEFILIQDGCITQHAVEYVEASFVSTITINQAALAFQAFRFMRNMLVNFNINVRACAHGFELSCRTDCSDRRRKRDLYSRYSRSANSQPAKLSSTIIGSRFSRDTHGQKLQDTTRGQELIDTDMLGPMEFELQMHSQVVTEEPDSKLIRTDGYNNNDNKEIEDIQLNAKIKEGDEDDSIYADMVYCLTKSQVIIIGVLLLLLFVISSVASCFHCCKAVISCMYRGGPNEIIDEQLKLNTIQQ